MTKARAPLSFAQAVTKVAGQIGWAEAAALVNRSDRTVRLWSEPDQDASPTVDQALALDAAYIAAGGDGAPIAETYMMLLDVRAASAIACYNELARTIALAARETGDAIAYAIPIARPGASAAEVQRAMIEVEESRSALARLGSLLKSFLSPGAGSAVGNTGGAR